MANDSLMVVRPSSDLHFIGNFDGEDRYLRFDMNAFAEMEVRFGSMENVETIMEKPSMKDVRTMLWIGLIHSCAVLDEVTGEPIKYTITPYQVGSWITSNNMQELMGNLGKALNDATPSEDEVAPQLKEATPLPSADKDGSIIADPNE